MKQGIYSQYRALSLLSALLFSTVCSAAPVSYVDLALGLGVHVLDDSDQGAASEVIKVGVGIQWLPFVSTQLGIWSWSSGDQKESETEQDEVGNFDGLSASWELVLQLPMENKGADLTAGPYFRYGRHCWSAVLTGLVKPWSKSGCSDLSTVGFSFPSGVEKNAGLYIEFTRTAFDDLFSSSLQLGARLAF